MTYNFGIIGAGMIADFHARAIKSLSNATLIGICGSNPLKTRELADKYQCQAFVDHHDMLASDEIDIVTIATPSGAHMEPAIEAARRGKHVLCEKPIEISLERIDRMIRAHSEAGTYLGGIFNYRFTESVQLLKAAIEHGRFGVISYASTAVPWWRSDEYYKSSWRGTWALDGGGALMNQSIHMIDILQYLMGPIDTLQGNIATLGHSIEVEDTATAIVQFTNKALGTIHGSTASFPGQPRRLEITGTRGTVIMEDHSFTVWQFADQTEADKEILKKYGKTEKGGAASDPKAISFELHAKNIAAFISAIEEKRPFEIDGTEARKAVETILSIYRTASKK
ncbi:MAG TPA: Gfo/Idh/MocA family oxidoreductase [Puia sp.]|nr:Gfo/Idh/MocA family oxidoreductase [Puia sp.]